MTDAETLIRAREAAIAAGFARNVGHSPESIRAEEKAIRGGQRDNHWGVKCALQALRDIDKPVADPDLIEARDICATIRDLKDGGLIADDYRSESLDNTLHVSIALAALRRGRKQAQ